MKSMAATSSSSSKASLSPHHPPLFIPIEGDKEEEFLQTRMSFKATPASEYTERRDSNYTHCPTPLNSDKSGGRSKISAKKRQDNSPPPSPSFCTVKSNFFVPSVARVFINLLLDLSVSRELYTETPWYSSSDAFPLAVRFLNLSRKSSRASSGGAENGSSSEGDIHETRLYRYLNYCQRVEEILEENECPKTLDAA